MIGKYDMPRVGGGGDVVHGNATTPDGRWLVAVIPKG